MICTYNFPRENQIFIYLCRDAKTFRYTSIELILICIYHLYCTTIVHFCTTRLYGLISIANRSRFFLLSIDYVSSASTCKIFYNRAVYPRVSVPRQKTGRSDVRRRTPRVRIIINEGEGQKGG